MHRILMTTAIVGFMAAPAAADDHKMRETGQMQGMGINASTLMDKDVYMPRQGQAGMSMETDSDNDMATMGSDAGDSDMIQRDGDTVTVQSDMAMENDATQSGTMDGNMPTGSWSQMDMASGVTDVPEGWQRVGEIDDVILSEDGEVRALLVDAGGFLGMGEEQKRIEMSSLQFVNDTDDEGRYYVVFDGDRSLFEDQDNYDATSSRGAGEMRASENDDMPSPESRIEERVDWASLTTEDLLGIAVYGTNDNWLGDLSELDVTESGNVGGAIIDVGGFLGIGEKPVRMSMDQIDFRRTSGGDLRAYVSATETELENMPEWTGEDT